jgi:hypothetical protein
VVALIRALLPVLGREVAWGHTTTHDGMIAGIARTLRARLDEISAEYATNCADAATRAEAIERARADAERRPVVEADLDLARRRARASAEAARGRLATLRDVEADIVGFSGLLGPDLTDPLRLAMIVQRETYCAILDPTEQRAANLELDLIPAGRE